MRRAGSGQLLLVAHSSLENVLGPQPALIAIALTRRDVHLVAHAVGGIEGEVQQRPCWSHQAVVLVAPTALNLNLSELHAQAWLILMILLLVLVRDVVVSIN